MYTPEGWTRISVTRRARGPGGDPDRRFIAGDAQRPSVYRTGHLGVALLVYAPVGVALVLAGRADLAVVGEVAMLWLATLPDYDLRVPFLTHRGFTHTVGFALLVGLALGAGGWVAGTAVETASRPVLAGFGFGVGVLAVGAHLLGDVITPAGITPFWPVSGRTYTFRVARADSVAANYGLFALGVFVTVAGVLVLGRVP